MSLGLYVAPRFDYGAVKPWIRRAQRPASLMAIGGADGLLVSGDFPLAMKHRHDLVGRMQGRAGPRARLSIIYRLPEDLDEGRSNRPKAVCWTAVWKRP